MVKVLWSGLIYMLLLSGCGWNGTPTRVNDFTPLTSITISAVSSKVAAGTSTTLTATGNFSGLFSRDITDEVVWSSVAPTVASFPFATNKNRVKAGAVTVETSAILTATARGITSAEFPLTVTNAKISTITISPATVSVPKGLTTRFTARGDFADGTFQDLTFDAVWSSSPGTFATISNDPASKGLATATVVGDELVTATFDATPSGAATLSVIAPTLQSIVVTPANSSITGLAKTVPFVATGTYSDGSPADITTQVSWASSQTGVATIVVNSGVATSVAQGTTSISATLGSISGKTDLTVKTTVLSISPTSLNLIVGQSHQFTATESPNLNVTSNSEWTSSAPTIATVGNTASNKGFVAAVAVGTVTISTTYGGQIVSATITVTAQ